MTHKKKLWLIFGGLAALGCVLVCAAGVLVAQMAGRLNAAQTTGLRQVGSAAPNFVVTGLSGEKIALADYGGTPVVLSFSTTWCPECRKAAPLLQALQAQHPDVVVLTIDVKEPAGTVRRYAEEHDLGYVIGLDEQGTVMDRYHVSAVPTLFFIDAEGVIKARLMGIDGTPAQLETQLRAIGAGQ